MSEKALKALDRLEEAWGNLNKDFLTHEEGLEIIQIFSSVIEKVSEKMASDIQNEKLGLTDENKKTAKELRDYYGKWMRYMKSLQGEFENKVNSDGKILREDVEGDIQEIRNMVEAFKAVPGDKGDKPTREELLELIEPLIPKIKDGSPDTPDEVIDKVNESEKKIKAERVEGFSDLERIAKANANFNPTMGPSFADLKRLQDQITASGANNSGGKVSINYIIDGGGIALTTGVKGFVEIPYAMTITGWQIFADQVGSVVVDVWKDSYANFPPTVGDTIAGSEKPTLSSAQNNQDLSLSTWTTGLTAGDILAYNVESISTVTRVTVSIIGVKN